MRLPEMNFTYKQTFCLLAVKEWSVHDNGDQILTYYVGICKDSKPPEEEVADV